MTIKATIVMPNYSYESGLNLRHFDFNEQGESQELTRNISLEQIREVEAMLSPNNPKYLEFRRALDETHFMPIKTLGKNGKTKSLQMEYVVVGQKDENEEVIVVVPGWDNDIRRPKTAISIAALALTLDKPVVAINTLGQGRSSRAPIDVARASARQGSYMPHGEIHNQAVERIIEEVEPSTVTIIGESRGHRLALGMMATGLKVDNAVLVDGPGFPGIGLKGLARGMRAEMNHARQYISNYPEGLEGADPLIGEYYEASRIGNHLFRRNFWQHYIRDVLVLGRSGYLDLAASLPNIHNKIETISLGESHLTNQEAMQDACRIIATDNSCPPNVRHTIVEGATHAYAARSVGAKVRLLTNSL